MLKAILHQFHTQAQPYDYELRPSDETLAILSFEEIAQPHVMEGPPSLPPFLRCSADDVDDDVSLSSDASARTSESSAEFINLACEEDDTKTLQCYFTGCTYVNTENILLTDWSNNVLRLTNQHGILCDSLPLEKSPWDITSARDGQAVVTVPKLRKVLVVEVEPNLHIVSSFNTHGECFGVCKVRGGYVVTCDACSRTPSVQMYTDNGGVQWSLDVDDLGQRWFRCPLHVCTDYLQTMIYVSDSGANCVYSISLTGEILSTFKHKDLNYPTGVIFDRHNYLYVCSKKTSMLLKFNKDGSKEATVMRESDSVCSPCAVCRHPDGDHFIVTDLSVHHTAGYWKLNIG